MDGLKADASDRGAVMKMLCCAPEKGTQGGLFRDMFEAFLS